MDREPTEGGTRVDDPATALAFQAVAEPRRRAILSLVKNEPRSVSEIAAHVNVSQQAVSQHLRVLLDAEMVRMERSGRQHLYVIRPKGLAAVREFIDDLWMTSLADLKDAAEDHGT